ncbi:MAG TPA: flavin reductase family protein [Acidimicrobiales bacterium]|nr:flavin reductase family protein [Acidimicrobiales bacterium]
MDPQEKKVALRAITYGLYVMTGAGNDELAADGVNWLTQASFEPPLVAAAVKADSKLHAVVSEAGTFAVNVLAEDQLDVVKAFFRSTTVEGDRINGQRFARGGETGSPILDVAPYWFECRVTDTVARGDHTVFVGEVVGAGVRDASRPPLTLRSTGMNYGG